MLKKNEKLKIDLIKKIKTASIVDFYKLGQDKFERYFFGESIRK
jgi:hypothetical protein